MIEALDAQTLNRVLNVMQQAFFVATLPAAIFFPIWYHLKMRWQSSQMGRHVMGYSVVVAMLYLSGVLRIFFSGPLATLVIRTVLTGAMMYVVWWRVVVFVSIRRRVARERQESLDHPVEDLVARKPETGVPGLQTEINKSENPL